MNLDMTGITTDQHGRVVLDSQALEAIEAQLQLAGGIGFGDEGVISNGLCSNDSCDDSRNIVCDNKKDEDKKKEA